MIIIACVNLDKGKGPYGSVQISGFRGRQAAGDISHKPSSSPAVLPGPRLPSQLQSVTAVGRYQFMLGEQRHIMCVNDLTRVAARQRNIRLLNLHALWIASTIPSVFTHTGCIAVGVGRAFSRVCLFVCLFVRALKGKRLEVSTPNFVHVYSIAVARHSLGMH